MDRCEIIYETSKEISMHVGLYVFSLFEAGCTVAKKHDGLYVFSLFEAGSTMAMRIFFSISRKRKF
jgi:hypothetical protein